MAVKIELLEQNEDGPVFKATDLVDGNEVPVKNWFEKSKDKWHCVLGPNSANRKYVAHNEIFANIKDGVYTVEDKTTGPRTLGTSQPDRKLIPFMTEEDKAEYDAIIARAIENRNSQKKKPMTKEEKIAKQIAKLTAQLAELEAMDNADDISAVTE